MAYGQLNLPNNVAFITITVVLLATLGSFASILLSYAIKSRRRSQFPPGPAGLPVIGNLHQIPQKKAYFQWHQWSKEYGSIVGLKFGPQNVVILNKAKHVQELFDKRGALYNGRPKNHIGEDIITHLNAQILLADYGPEWRRLRKSIQGLLSVTAVESLLPIQEAESTQLLVEMLRDPKESYTHIRRYATAVVLASVYGQRGKTYDSPKVQALYHAQEQFTSILEPGAAPPVDIFPILQRIPASWKKWALRIREEQRSLYRALLEETKEGIRRRGALGCLLGKLLEPGAKHGLNEEQVMYTGGTLMEAGSDTTSMTLHSWCIAMIENPDVLKTIQTELDRVCGSRMPSANDLQNLPCLRATMSETLRWRPVAPGGIPHKLMQDDTYEGYVLPKGTVLFANTWSIHNDEEDYEEPARFWPERWARNPATGTRVEGEADGRRATYAFGAGRRVCPGQNMAENSLMLVMARIAWAFDLSAELGHPIDSAMETGYSDGFLSGPLPFQMRIQVRSKMHEEAIVAAHEAAKPFLASFES